jgi:hypothetical protein
MDPNRLPKLWDLIIIHKLECGTHVEHLLRNRVCPKLATVTTVYKSPSKSDLLSETQYAEPESIAMGNELVSKSTPSGNALTNEDALALMIIGKLVKQSAILSLPPLHSVFQATVDSGLIFWDLWVLLQ